MIIVKWSMPHRISAQIKCERFILWHCTIFRILSIPWVAFCSFYSCAHCDCVMWSRKICKFMQSADQGEIFWMQKYYTTNSTSTIMTKKPHTHRVIKRNYSKWIRREIAFQEIFNFTFLQLNLVDFNPPKILLLLSFAQYLLFSCMKIMKIIHFLISLLSLSASSNVIFLIVQSKGKFLYLFNHLMKYEK